MRKKVGLALGAGGAKGLAHIGILQVLLEADIPIDLVAGSSIGALVAASYAAGADPYMLGKLAENLNNTFYVDVTVPRLGLLKGDRALELIHLLSHGKSFDQLRIPLAVVATDIERAEKVVFTDGDVAQAVRASISIPGIFTPVQIEDRLLVDGAVIDPLPLAELKKMGADFTIGVDVKVWPSTRQKVNSIYEVILQSIEILESEVGRKYLDQADFLICPDMSNVGTLDFHKAAECIAIGREIALENIGSLKSKLQDLGVLERG
ncbi:MAG: patatin-like phospholipase family protein [Peptococcia bacterium]